MHLLSTKMTCVPHFAVDTLSTPNTICNREREALGNPPTCTCLCASSVSHTVASIRKSGRSVMFEIGFFLAITGFSCDGLGHIARASIWCGPSLSHKQYFSLSLPFSCLLLRLNRPIRTGPSARTRSPPGSRSGSSTGTAIHSPPSPGVCSSFPCSSSPRRSTHCFRTMASPRHSSATGG